MEEIKNTIANKLVTYRKAAKLTQLEVAEKLCYSDKAVSKWERGESIPDITVLKELANIYNISIEDLLSEGEPKAKTPVTFKSFVKQRRFMVGVMSIGSIWVLATIIFVLVKMFSPSTAGVWLAYIYAIPASFALAFIYCELWWTNLYRCISLSGLFWTTALVLYLTLNMSNAWLLFLIPIPLQVLTIIWFYYRKKILKLK